MIPSQELAEHIAKLDILLNDKVCDAFPVPTIGDGHIEENLDLAIVKVGIAKTNHSVIKTIGLFEFVPEKKIVFGKLERLKVVLVEDTSAEHVHSGE